MYKLANHIVVSIILKTISWGLFMTHCYDMHFFNSNHCAFFKFKLQAKHYQYMYIQGMNNLLNPPTALFNNDVNVMSA